MTHLLAASRRSLFLLLLPCLGSCAPDENAAQAPPIPAADRVGAGADGAATEPSGDAADGAPVDEETGAERVPNPFRKQELPKPPPDGAKVSFHESYQSFGTIRDGDRPVLRFWFRSEGAAPLVMSRMKSSCGCGSAVLKARRRKQDVTVEKDEEWNTGAVGFVELTIDSTSLSGHRKVFLRITSNAQEDEIVLEAEGTVNEAFEVRPPWSEWREDGAGHLVTTATAECLLEGPVEWIRLPEAMAPPGLTITGTEGPEADGRHWQLEARWDQAEGTPPDPMQVLLAAQVQGEEQPRVFTWSVRLPD